MPGPRPRGSSAFPKGRESSFAICKGEGLKRDRHAGELVRAIGEKLDRPVYVTMATLRGRGPGAEDRWRESRPLQASVKSPCLRSLDWDAVNPFAAGATEVSVSVDPLENVAHPF